MPRTTHAEPLRLADPASRSRRYEDSCGGVRLGSALADSMSGWPVWEAGIRWYWSGAVPCGHRWIRLTFVAEAGAQAAYGEQKQAGREDGAGADPGAAVSWGADRPGPRGGPVLEKGVLAERQVSKGERPGEQSAGDQRTQQPDAGDPGDVPGEHQDALVEVLPGGTQLQQRDRQPAHPGRRE